MSSRLLVRVPEGAELPPGFGAAWYDPKLAMVWGAPVPLNLLAGVAVRLYDLARRGLNPSRLRCLESRCEQLEEILAQEFNAELREYAASPEAAARASRILRQAGAEPEPGRWSC